MSRYTNALLQEGQAYAAEASAPVLNPQIGGTMGYAPVYAEYVSFAAYIRKQLFAVVLEGPRGFRYLPNPTYWYGALKSLFETQALVIEGLNEGLEASFEDTTPVGGAGEYHQSFTDVKRTRSSLSLQTNEKYGQVWFTYLSGWIRNLIMDPDTKQPAIVTLGRDNIPNDWLPDMYTAVVIFIEGDPIQKSVQKAWLGANIAPTTTGESIGRREMTAGGDNPLLTIPFTGFFQVGLGVRQLAQTILQSINLEGANAYNQAPAVSGLEANVAAAPGGYAAGVNNLRTNGVTSVSGAT